MELGPQNHTGDGLLGASSIIVVYMDPLGVEQVFDDLGRLGFGARRCGPCCWLAPTLSNLSSVGSLRWLHVCFSSFLLLHTPKPNVGT